MEKQIEVMKQASNLLKAVEVKAKLTANQWNWVYYFIIQDFSLKEIAEMNGVSVETVKSLGKQTRRKLKRDRDSLRLIEWHQLSTAIQALT